MKISLLDIPPAGKPIIEMSDVELDAFESLLDLKELRTMEQQQAGSYKPARRKADIPCSDKNWITFRR